MIDFDTIIHIRNFVNGIDETDGSIDILNRTLIMSVCIKALSAEMRETCLVLLVDK